MSGTGESFCELTAILNSGMVKSIVMERFVLGFAIFLALGSCTGKSEGSMYGVSTLAPRLTGQDLEGTYRALEDFRGKVVLLNVWATWCPPCRQELPELRAIQTDHGGDDFSVLGVSIDREGDAKKVRHLAKTFDLNYPVILDPSSRSIDAYEIRGYPTSFVIGRDGMIRWRREGIILPDDSDVAGQIRAALAQPVDASLEPPS